MLGHLHQPKTSLQKKTRDETFHEGHDLSGDEMVVNGNGPDTRRAWPQELKSEGYGSRCNSSLYATYRFLPPLYPLSFR